MRQWLGVGVAMAAFAAFGVGGSFGAVVTREAADCSATTARQLVDQYRLNNFLVQNPVGQVLCGSFTGPNSEAMAVTIGSAPTCWPVQRWAVFRFTGGAWQLVLDEPAFLDGPLVAVGSDIKETTPVFRAGDPRCIPSGGTHARLWHWDGTRLVAGPWQQVTKGSGGTVATFYSPTGNLSCEIADDNVRGHYAHCQSAKSPHSVRLSSDGRLSICRGARCVGNAGENTPTLAYGRQVTVGRFRCVSLQTGVRCTVSRTGKGFLIDRDGVRRIGASTGTAAIAGRWAGYVKQNNIRGLFTVILSLPSALTRAGGIQIPAGGCLGTVRYLRTDARGRFVFAMRWQRGSCINGTMWLRRLGPNALSYRWTNGHGIASSGTLRRMG